MTFEDPYAPPKQRSTTRPHRRQRVDFIGEKRNILVVALLWLCTCGIYNYVWMILRRKFLDSLSSSRKLGQAPWIVFGLMFVPVPLVAVLKDSLAWHGVLIQGMQVGVGVAALVILFRTRRILQDHFAAKRIPVDVSGVATFFLGVLYLQMVINNAAEVQLAKQMRPRRKKKRRPITEDAEWGSPGSRR